MSELGILPHEGNYGRVFVGSEWDEGDPDESSEHQHVWGQPETARFTGNPHLKCQVPGCNEINMDLEDAGTKESKVNTSSRKTAQKIAREVAVRDLKPGDLVDLMGDPYVDEDEIFEFELARVVEDPVDEGTAILVHFDNTSIGFPPDHKVKVGSTQKTGKDYVEAELASYSVATTKAKVKEVAKAINDGATDRDVDVTAYFSPASSGTMGIKDLLDSTLSNVVLQIYRNGSFMCSVENDGGKLKVS